MKLLFKQHFHVPPGAYLNANCSYNNSVPLLLWVPFCVKSKLSEAITSAGNCTSVTNFKVVQLDYAQTSMNTKMWFCKKYEVILWDIQQLLCYHKCFFVLSRKLDSKWKLTQANSNAHIPIHQSNFYVTNPEKSLYCCFLEVPLIVYA